MDFGGAVSTVITISRSPDKPPLVWSDIVALCANDASLQLRDECGVGCKLGKRELYINFENGALWTDDLPRNDAAFDAALARLMAMARALDAQCCDEAGEDLLATATPAKRTHPLLMVLTTLLMLLAAPLMLLVLLIRMPYAMLQIAMNTRGKPGRRR
ncbi:hypothetical protein SAMN02745857_03054 [Andreprevotia lacus DSM 23236]|uniref:Uncharacterized protein n=1 Tax=Andreprevotia lacus DSM 23236 TaxID=1121001 RepID=A0A1W1XWR3_9NEIS|nr:hypothetical protein SAMN02745857_03054 [Andreprevotia lacus DSM 23236]